MNEKTSILQCNGPLALRKNGHTEAMAAQESNKKTRRREFRRATISSNIVQSVIGSKRHLKKGTVAGQGERGGRL